MVKNQRPKRIIVWLVLTWAIAVLFYLFFSYYDHWTWIIEQLLHFKWYMYIFLVSIFLAYLFLTSPKSSGKTYTTIVLLINIVLLSYLFFVKNMWLSLFQVLIFWVVILLIFLLSKINHWIRYPLVLILFCIWIGTLLLSFLPSFNQGPDEKRFFATQNPVLHVYANTNKSTITIGNNKQQKFVSTQETQDQEIDFDGELTIRYASKTNDKNNFAILEWSDGSHSIIFPQTDFVIKKGGTNISWEITRISPLLQKREQLLKENFEEKKRIFFVEEAWWTYLENATINKLITYYLNTLFSIDAERFGQKLLNFQAYQKYFHIKNEKNYMLWFSKWAVEGAVKNRWTSAWDQTKLKQRLDRL